MAPRRALSVVLLLAALAAALPGVGEARQTSRPGDVVLVSRPSGLAAVGPAVWGGSFSSGHEALSADGRYVAFVSESDGLAVDDDDLVTNAYVKDTLTGTVTLVSRATGPAGAAANRNSFDVALSSSGGVVRVVFATEAALDPSDTNGATDVYLRNITAATTVLISRQSLLDGGAVGNGESNQPSLSEDGTRIAFTSVATNLSGADGDGFEDVYVRTPATAQTVLASRATGAAGVKGDYDSRRASLDADGSAVAFTSYSTNLSSDDDDLTSDVFVRDLSANTTTFVSRATGAAGAAHTGPLWGSPQISASGTRVAFGTASSLVAADTNGSLADVYVRDLVAFTTALASRANGGAGFSGATAVSAEYALSGDGNRVAFGSADGGLVADDTNGLQDVFVRDLGANTTVLASRATGATGALGDAFSRGSALNADGSVVVFWSDANAFSDVDNDAFASVFARNLIAGTTELVSGLPGAQPPVARGPVQAYLSSESVSGDGRVVVFSATARTLTPEGVESVTQVYARDLLSGETTLASRAAGASGAPADADTGDAVVSDDGRRVAFSSAATNLVPGDSNAVSDVFVRDLAAGTTTLVSRATGVAGAIGNGPSSEPSIDDSGALVAFSSEATNLDPADAHAAKDVYVRNLLVESLELVSRADGASGAHLNKSSNAPALSQDGTRVAFASQAGFDPADVDVADAVYVRDLWTKATVYVSRADGIAGVGADGFAAAPAVDADGTRVAFMSDASNLVAGVPIGVRVYLRDLATGATVLVSRADGEAGPVPGSGSGRPAISSDGTRVAFQSSATDLVAGDGNGSSDVFVRDLALGTTRLVSVSSSGQLGNMSTVTAAISADGNCVALLSWASNLDPLSWLGGRDLSQAYLATTRGECPASPPETLIGSGPGARTNARTVHVSFQADEPATFECRLDSGAYAPCTTPYATGPLRAGPHRFVVRAIDTAGNVDNTAAEAAFAVNAAPSSRVDKVTRKQIARGLRVLRGTAADSDGKVRRVEVAVLRITGQPRVLAARAASCEALTRSGSLRRIKVTRNVCKPSRFLRAKGTRRWTLRLRRPLPPGRYVVISRAVDLEGLRQLPTHRGPSRRSFALGV